MTSGSLWLQLRSGAPPENPTSQSANVVQKRRDNNPSEKKPKQTWNYTANGTAQALLYIQHNQADASGNHNM
jgi:hypothetical protein